MVVAVFFGIASCYCGKQCPFGAICQAQRNQKYSIVKGNKRGPGLFHEPCNF